MSKLAIRPPALPKLDNDFGEKPLLFARFTDDLAQISVLGVFGSILATVAFGGFALPLGLIVTAWDSVYAWRFGQKMKPGVDNHLAAVVSLLKGEITSAEQFEARCEGRELSGAITVPSEPVSDALSVFEPGTKGMARSPKTFEQVLQSTYALPLQSFLIMGAPGSGKGMFTAYAAAMAKKFAQAEVWVLDGKAKCSEAGYWARCDRHYLLQLRETDPDLGEKVLGVLAEFQQRQSARANGLEVVTHPLILVIEELNALVTKLPRHVGLQIGAILVTSISLGRADQCAVWGSGQAPNLELLGIKGKSNRDVFSKLIAVDGENPGKATAIAKLMGLLYDAKQCQPDEHYWLTDDGLITVPKLPEPPQQEWGSNVIDFRPQSDSVKAVTTPGENAAVFVEQEPEPAATTYNHVPMPRFAEGTPPEWIATIDRVVQWINSREVKPTAEEFHKKFTGGRSHLKTEVRERLTQVFRLGD